MSKQIKTIQSENKNEFDRLSKGGHKRFLKNHTSQAVGQKFLDICESLIN